MTNSAHQKYTYECLLFGLEIQVSGVFCGASGFDITGIVHNGLPLITSEMPDSIIDLIEADAAVCLRNDRERYESVMLS